jgi:5-oxoprolinase (ATP-hydrolysing) subunit A
MKLIVDLNADLGEGAGYDDELLKLVTSANISCGFHAGDPLLIFRSIRAAKEQNVSVGAHPSYDDKANFGRKELTVSPEELFAQLTYQIGAFYSLAIAAGTRATHIKPHGALYNAAAREQKIAEAVARAIVAVDSALILFAPPESALERAGRTAKLKVVREVFADRNYLADGSLVPRSRSDALLKNPKEAASRVLRMLREGKVWSVDQRDIEISAETICLHGDTPGAVEFARELRIQLESQGVTVAAPRNVQ